MRRTRDKNAGTLQISSAFVGDATCLRLLLKQGAMTTKKTDGDRFVITPIWRLLALGIALSIIPLNLHGGTRTIRVTYGKSRCSYCEMLFQDKRFGAELELSGDSLRVFDATECLAAFLISNNIPERQIRKIWSVDYNRPATLVDGRKAVYVQSDAIPSPMEVNIAAFGSRKGADSVTTKLGGRLLKWPEVLRLVGIKWFHQPR